MRAYFSRKKTFFKLKKIVAIVTKLEQKKTNQISIHSSYIFYKGKWKKEMTQQLNPIVSFSPGTKNLF